MFGDDTTILASLTALISGLVGVLVGGYTASRAWVRGRLEARRGEEGEAPQAVVAWRRPDLTDSLKRQNRELSRALLDDEFEKELRRNLALEAMLAGRIEEELKALAGMDLDEVIAAAGFEDIEDTEENRSRLRRIGGLAAKGAAKVGSKALGLLNGFIKAKLGLGGG